MIVDTHLHYFPGSAEHDPEILAKSGVLDGAWILSANAIIYGQASDEDVLEVCRKYSDFLIPFGYLDFDEAGPERIDYLCEQGCIGLKAIWPEKAYDDRSYFPYYERAEKLGMPIVFHIGGSPYWGPDLVRIDAAKREWSKNMMPITLDGVAKTFPTLPIVIGHMGGGPWAYELSLYLAEGHPNMYLELSCNYDFGIIDRAARMGNGTKLLFGTDAPYEYSVGVARFWEGYFRYVFANEETCRLVMGENAQRIIKEAKAKQGRE